MSETKKAIDMTPEELEQWLDTLEIEDTIPGFYFSNPDPYFKITPTTEPKNKKFWFGEDGHIHGNKNEQKRTVYGRKDPRTVHRKRVYRTG